MVVCQIRHSFPPAKVSLHTVSVMSCKFAHLFMKGTLIFTLKNLRQQKNTSMHVRTHTCMHVCTQNTYTQALNIHMHSHKHTYIQMRRTFPPNLAWWNTSTLTSPHNGNSWGSNSSALVSVLLICCVRYHGHNNIINKLHGEWYNELHSGWHNELHNHYQYEGPAAISCHLKKPHMA